MMQPHGGQAQPNRLLLHRLVTAGAKYGLDRVSQQSKPDSDRRPHHKPRSSRFP